MSAISLSVIAGEITASPVLEDTSKTRRTQCWLKLQRLQIKTNLIASICNQL